MTEKLCWSQRWKKDKKLKEKLETILKGKVDFLVTRIENAL